MPWTYMDPLTYLDLNLVEGLAIVHTNHASNHLRDNDHVAKMCPYRLWLLTWRSLTLLQGWQRDFFKIRTFQTQNSQTWSSDEVSHISKFINTDTWTYCFAEFLDQGHGLAFQTPLKPVAQIPTDKTIQSVRNYGNPTLLHLSSLHFLLYSRGNTDINNNSTI
jgi:hypothetical protein